MSVKTDPTIPATAIEQLLMREDMGLSRYRKAAPRDEEKRAILLQLALAKISKAEGKNFLPLGFRRRRVLCTGQ